MTRCRTHFHYKKGQRHTDLSLTPMYTHTLPPQVFHRGKCSSPSNKSDNCFPPTKTLDTTSVPFSFLPLPNMTASSPIH